VRVVRIIFISMSGQRTRADAAIALADCRAFAWRKPIEKRER
jgi:hypothetical protein